MKNQLTTVAALPGSGGGMTASLPAEVWRRDVKPVATKYLLNEDAYELENGTKVTALEVIAQPDEFKGWRKSNFDQIIEGRIKARQDKIIKDLLWSKPDLYPEFTAKKRPAPRNDPKLPDGKWETKRYINPKNGRAELARYKDGELLYTLDETTGKKVT